MNITNQQNNLSTPTHLLLEDAIDFKKIAGELYHFRWLIFGVSLFTFFIAFLYTFTLQPQYKSSALIRISSQSSSDVFSNIGLKSTPVSQEDTEIALIRTRYILEPVIKENALNVIAKANYFPIFGAWIARHHQGDKPAKPFFGLSSYAWGGEAIQVNYFAVPPEYQGQNFRLVAGEKNTYQVYSSQGKLMLTGKVGERANSRDYPGLSLQLKTLKAHPGTEFSLSNQDPIGMVNGLISRLQIRDVSTDINETGIVSLQLTGADPELTQRVLDAIVNYSVNRNIQKKSQEAQKTLDFLSQKLPELRDSLAKAEDAMNQYHAKSGTLNMSLTSHLLLQQYIEFKRALEKLKIQKVELLQIYTPEYPLIISTEQQQTTIEKKLDEIKTEIAKFPAMNQQEVNMERNIKLKINMYMSILNKMQQLEVTKAGIVGDISALGSATPAVQLPLHKLLLLIVGFFIGALISSVIVIIKSALSKTIDDFDKLENMLQIPIQAVIPYSYRQKQIEKLPSSSSVILAKQNPSDLAIESLRSLRISLHIQNPSASHQTIAIMGGQSDIGKSFIASNLAHIIADSGKRVLLIDADLRKGRLHQLLMQPNTQGLSEYLENKVNYEKVIRSISNNFFFIPCGTYTSHPLELFQRPYFQELLKQVQNQFDHIIIDTPPILHVTDSVLIARHCEVKLFVVSTPRDQIIDVKQSIKRARSHGIEITGIIFNHTKPVARYGSRYSQQRYAYGAS